MGNVAEGTDTVNPIRLVEEISDAVVPLFTAAAIEALKVPNNAGLGLAKILVEDAIRYDSIYPRARSYDNNFINAVEKMRNGDTVHGSNG